MKLFKVGTKENDEKPLRKTVMLDVLIVPSHGFPLPELKSQRTDTQMIDARAEKQEIDVFELF